MLLYMIRHGETENNLTKRHSGHSKTVLTEKGIEDGKIAGEKLKGIVFDKIYTSDLPRTQQTAKVALPDCEFEILPLIKEINVGMCTDRSVSDCEKEWGEKYIEAKKAYNYLELGGENAEMVRDRARAFLKMVAESGFERVAAFSHGAFMKHVADVVLKADLTKTAFLLNNCGVCIYQYKDGVWQLIKWNA